MWDLDYLECKHADTEVENKVLKGFNQNIRYVNNRYEVALLWKEAKETCSLQSNEIEARKRLDKLERKLSKESVYLRQGYNEVFQQMEKDGIIEEVLEVEVDQKNVAKTFYLPHRPVVKETSVSTKIRPVFDASASGPNGLSLNDCMETGPNLLPLLSDVLLRFRRHKHAVTSDIEKAFLQVSVRPEDRDVHRFLWRKDKDIRIMRITRVPFGNKASPFLLNATVRHHLASYASSQAIDELSENLYVDDLLTGADTEEEVLALINETSAIMLDAGMKLCKCSSNSSKVAESVQKCFDNKTAALDSVKVLGMRWIPKEDSFSFDGVIVPQEVVVTKRLVLSCIARVFDPLGLLSPFVVLIKILFQEIWKLGLGWDEMLPENLEKEFHKWVEDLQRLHELKIPRCYVSLSWKHARSFELHCFCDSSLKAYCAVVYLKVLEADTSVSVSLLLSKARVSPLKPITIPRLELLGAVVGAKLLWSVSKSLHMPSSVKYYCWTDSSIVLRWIKSDPTIWKMFVCNRVAQIQELTEPESWHHCPGKENPADCLTRGLCAEDMMNQSL